MNNVDEQFVLMNNLYNIYVHEQWLYFQNYFRINKYLFVSFHSKKKMAFSEICITNF